MYNIIDNQMSLFQLHPFGFLDTYNFFQNYTYLNLRKIKSAGFIAQELLALQKGSAIGSNLDLVSEDNPEKLEARYGNLLPVMVKAIQDQQQIIEDQKKRLDALEKLVNQLIQAKN